MLLAILGYVLMQLGIGAYISRRIKTEEDYLVAGRSLGYGLTTFTLFATWFGAETCIGAAGAIYTDGLSGGSADPFGYALCILLMGLVFAVPIWKRKLTTLADLFRQRYSTTVERTAIALMIPGSMFWAAAQIRAFGQVLSATSGIDVTLTITIAAGIVIVYTMFGGLLADAWTDLVQGIVLIAGLVTLFVIVAGNQSAGIGALIQPEQLQLFGGPEVGWLEVLETWAIPVIGSVTAAELLTRAIAARSPQVAQRSAFMAGGVYLLIGLIPVTIGLIGASLMPGLEDPEQLLPLVARQYLPPVLYALFNGALISAILSTVDSVLLVAASLLSHNIIVPLRPGLTERQKVIIARASVAGFGVLAYIMAIHAEGVYALVEEASAFGSAGLFVIIVCSLFIPWGGVYSAMKALLLGISAWVLGAYVLDTSYPYIVSLLAAGGGYAAAAFVETQVTARWAKAPG
ncbi:MAG: sodium:solute symporter family protein [Rhodothermales bacterium]|nr:sodium:solute symporter family protein [Rhodothermales bacterium]